MHFIEIKNVTFVYIISCKLYQNVFCGWFLIRSAGASSLQANQKYSVENMSKKFDCVTSASCDNDTKTEDRKLCDAGRIVCNMLTINAWRRKKAETVELNRVIDGLNQQVNHLHIQIVVLRRLLDTENSRVGKLTTEVQQIKIQAEERNQECENLKKVWIYFFHFFHFEQKTSLKMFLTLLGERKSRKRIGKS